MTRRLRRIVAPAAALLAAATICAALMSMPRTDAAFTATTDNNGNAFSAATSFGP